MTLFNVQSQSGELEKSLAGAYAFSPNGSSLPGKEGAGQLGVLTCASPTRSALGSLTVKAIPWPSCWILYPFTKHFTVSVFYTAPNETEVVPFLPAGRLYHTIGGSW